MGDTKIEWADSVWNPVTGCTPISLGCENCYAARMAKRLAGRWGYPEDEPFRVTLHPERLEEPFRWRKPKRVFVCSMGDLFHDDVPDEYIERVFNIMDRCSGEYRATGRCGHIFMVLTKRPARMKEFVDAWWKSYQEVGVEPYMDNVWLGVTAENQQMADERIPILLQTPAVVRFVSCEPLLSAIDLSHWLTCACDEYWPGQGHHPECPTQKLHWCIVGGETGPGARPVHPDWVRSLRDQCRAAGVPFFFKSWGEWLPNDVRYGCHNQQANYDVRHAVVDTDGHIREPGDIVSGAVVMAKMGKRAAGRLLDGRTWEEYPKEA